MIGSTPVVNWVVCLPHGGPRGTGDLDGCRGPLVTDIVLELNNHNGLINGCSNLSALLHP